MQTIPFTIVVAIAAVIGGVGALVVETAGRTTGASSLSASQRFSCLDISGKLTTQGVTPSISCLTSDGTAQLKITAEATPAPSASPSPRSTSRVQVNIKGSSRVQSSSSSAVIIEQNSQSSSGSGNVSNTNRSTTNINITNN